MAKNYSAPIGSPDRVEPSPAGPQTLSVEQAASRLGISRSTAYECVRNGSIPSLRFRRRIVIPAAVIDQLLGGSLVDNDRSVSAAS